MVDSEKYSSCHILRLTLIQKFPELTVAPLNAILSTAESVYRQHTYPAPWIDEDKSETFGGRGGRIRQLRYESRTIVRLASPRITQQVEAMVHRWTAELKGTSEEYWGSEEGARISAFFEQAGLSASEYKNDTYQVLLETEAIDIETRF